MEELRKYVEELFAHQPESDESSDLKEEILSNMLAKRNDLISQGMDKETATRQVKESLSSIEGLIEDNKTEETVQHQPAKMSKKTKKIIGAIVCMAVLTLIISSVVSSINNKKKSDYAMQQSDALTHDITVIEEYRSKYVGDMAAVSGIFYELPMNDIGMKFEIDSDKCTLTVDYLEPVWVVGEEKAYRNLVYNTTAAMASIDNLSAITYNFSGDSFYFTREQIEAVFGSDLTELQKESVWKEKVQSQLGAEEFVNQFYDSEV